MRIWRSAPRFLRRPINLVGFIAALIVLFLILTALSGDDQEDPDTGLAEVERGPDIVQVIPPDAPIVIGVSAALTGPIADLGTQYRDAVIVAVARWQEANPGALGDRAIAVVAEDDGCTEADVTMLAARRHLRRPALVGVIGPECSSGSRAAIPIYAAAGVVSISGSATLSQLAEEQPAGFFFRTAYRNDAQGVLIGVYVSDEQFIGGEHAFVIDDSESYGIGLADDIEAQLAGVDVRVTRASIIQGTVDFGALAQDIVAAAPDILIFAGFNPEAGLILRQARDAGYSGPYATGDAVCGGPDCAFIEALDDLAEGTAFSGCSPLLDPGFVAEFQAIHDESDGDDGDGRPTASFVAHYADAATILLNALAAVAEQQPDGSLRLDPSALRSAVATSSLSGGLSGDVTFDENGDRAAGTLEGLEDFARNLGLVPCFVQDGRISYFN